ncbi:MAG: hypothetical protein MUE81_16695 [Thermoflexibacter sp.]|jgi:hypothetical protein|nr:hypothetical protein [Thermoflexibacter sp.]
MGYGIMPYRVSVERLNTCFGTDDKAKRSKIKKNCLTRATSIDNLDYNGTAPKFMDIVEELLDGKATHGDKYGYLYWYAIEGFIEVLGRPLYNADWYPASADIFWEHKDFAPYYLGAPIKIPTPYDAIPVVFVLKNAFITNELEQSLRSKLSDNYQSAQVWGWLRDAKRYKQDLVLFYY